MCECQRQVGRIQATIFIDGRERQFCAGHICYELFNSITGDYETKLSHVWGYSYKQTEEQTKKDKQINATQKMLETKEERYGMLSPGREIGLSEALSYVYGKNRFRAGLI